MSFCYGDIEISFLISYSSIVYFFEASFFVSFFPFLSSFLTYEDYYYYSYSGSS